MKRLLLLNLLILLGLMANAQVNIYNPNADAKAEIAAAINKAKQENKHVFIQIGGNWCPWCVKLHNFMNADSTISEILTKNYVVVKVNYSKENKNLDVLEKLEKPQRFGFPVLVILNSNGNRIHTQDSGLLESGDGYDRKKVLNFLKNWTPEALK
ncbi:MAG: thioredoxin family protein [Tenuifilum sp.]|uniref:thioredoxin family protein n=1 Tax=Tenuifilum sp. TaxID=2760880 RepID=UPI001B4604EE|nr:thioredoxin family protein [Bacteroidales bacterium]HOK60345.1 thioredoxin family protein [Tenuifilum sp.]MBP9029227.1 thioredoxin family protein [Bacteroidales bacterium]HOK85213.1 thioredoxin family protein [Tenuifilum sp.]HON69589.1 thioredoxin family protein [Tenuifilum sp.]